MGLQVGFVACHLALYLTYMYYVHTGDAALQFRVLQCCNHAVGWCWRSALRIPMSCAMHNMASRLVCWFAAHNCSCSDVVFCMRHRQVLFFWCSTLQGHLRPRSLPTQNCMCGVAGVAAAQCTVALLALCACPRPHIVLRLCPVPFRFIFILCRQCVLGGGAAKLLPVFL